MLAASDALLGRPPRPTSCSSAPRSSAAPSAPPERRRGGHRHQRGRGRRRTKSPGVGPALRRRPAAFAPRSPPPPRRRHRSSTSTRPAWWGAGRGLLRRETRRLAELRAVEARRVRRPAVRRGLRHDRRRGLAGRASGDDRTELSGRRPAPLQVDGLRDSTKSPGCSPAPAAELAQLPCRVAPTSPSRIRRCCALSGWAENPDSPARPRPSSRPWCPMKAPRHGDPFGRPRAQVRQELLRHYRVTLHDLVSGLTAGATTGPPPSSRCRTSCVGTGRQASQRRRYAAQVAALGLQVRPPVRR